MLFQEPHLTKGELYFRYNTVYSLREKIILEEIYWREENVELKKPSLP